MFGHYVCNNWQVLSAIILISIDLDNLNKSINYSCPNVLHRKNSENKDTELLLKLFQNLKSSVYCLRCAQAELQT